jgi:uncharacterized protein
MGTNNKLPTYIDPKRLGIAGTRLKGSVALTPMSRLHELLHDIQGEIHIDWLFELDDKQRPTIRGRIRAQLIQLCQRCLEPMPTEIDTQIALVVLTHEPNQNDQLLAGFEAITLESTPVLLTILVEDELILALPLIPKHSTCPSNNSQLDSSSPKKDFSVQKNPFHILNQLKIKK